MSFFNSSKNTRKKYKTSCLKKWVNVLIGISQILSKRTSRIFKTDEHEHDIGEDIKRVLESGSYSKYIRIPKSLQDYLKMQDMIHREVSDHIQKIEVEEWAKYTNSLLKFDRGLRRKAKILE